MLKEILNNRYYAKWLSDFPGCLYSENVITINIYSTYTTYVNQV